MHKGEPQQGQQGQQREGQDAGEAASRQQPLPHKQAHLHARPRSSSPAEAGGLGMEGSLSTARSMGSLSTTADGSTSQRGRSSLAGSQSLRPPRPPVQQAAEGSGAPGGTPDSHQAFAGAALGRRPADGEESALLAEGWEAVDAADVSDPALAPARREFSMAHLVAPQADSAAVAGVTPRATSSSSAATTGSSVEAPAAFVGQARAKVRPRGCSVKEPALRGWAV